MEGDRMKVNVFDDCGVIRLSTHKVLFSERENEVCACIGTLDFPIEPEKKEVVKEKYPKVGVEACHINGETLVESTWIPSHAYDVKLVYKVKE
jgi:hypothetical protein